MENVATEEFISRTEALKDFEENNARNPYWTPQRVKTLLLRQPAADVAEVVHGKWFWADDGYCRCSECTQKAPLVQPLDDEPEAVMTKYYPNCGKKMDGREK